MKKLKSLSFNLLSKSILFFAVISCISSCDPSGNDEDDLLPENDQLKKEIQAFFVTSAGTSLETYNFLSNDGSGKVERFVSVSEGNITIEFDGDIEIENLISENDNAYQVKNEVPGKFIIRKEGKVVGERILVSHDKALNPDLSGYTFQKNGGSLEQWILKLKNFHTLKFIEQ